MQGIQDFSIFYFKVMLVQSCALITMTRVDTASLLIVSLPNYKIRNTIEIKLKLQRTKISDCV